MLLSILLVFTGCSSKKDFVYLADMTTDQGYPITNKYVAKIQRNDRLRITVTCEKPQLAMVFNVNPETITVSPDGNVTTAGGDNIYRVNEIGDINFPVFGDLHVAGESLSQAADKIRDLIVEAGLIKKPIVTIDFVDFKYTVLGAVGQNGTFKSESEQVTLLEAIANAGDLEAKADLGNIAVIREENGERRIYKTDIRDTRFFDSPAFYLRQNDIIYVQPKYAKKDGEDRTLQWVSLALSLTTAVTSIIWVTRR